MNAHFPLMILVLIAALACERRAPSRAHGTPSESHDHAAGGSEAHAHGEGDGACEGHEHGKEPGLALAGLRGLRFVPAPIPREEGAWYPGEAAADEASNILLSSPVKGIVSAIPVAPGRTVAQGTLLLSLQSPELARLKADWLGSRARLDRLEAELAREQRLFEAGAGSRRELDQARSERDTGRAEEEAARLALEARGLRPEEAGASFPIRALKAGRVGAWKVLVGQGVEAGQELGSFQSAQASLARVELPLPGPGGWSPGSQTEARNAQGQRWKARVEGVPASLSTDTKRLAYRLRLEGASLPLPGSPLEVRVPLEKAIILPQAAVQQVEGRWGVFVKEGEEARFRPVRRGPELGGDVMILEGLRPGQDVAVEGAYLLKALQLKRTRPEEDGHGH